MKETYKQGWNDYIDGIPFSAVNSTSEWQQGWIDCRDDTKESGKQFKLGNHKENHQ